MTDLKPLEAAVVNIGRSVSDRGSITTSEINRLRDAIHIAQDGQPEVPAGTFLEREPVLREKAARGWYEDEDVAICMDEIDRLRAELESHG